MLRIDRVACLAASVMLGGCMVIYPDPELPDVEVVWYEDECRPGTGAISMALVGLDSTSRVEVTVPCADIGYRFVNVARERYRFEAFLQDGTGVPFGRSDSEVDLRNGLNGEVYLYFNGF